MAAPAKASHAFEDVRVRFGTGVRQELDAEVRQLGAQRALVLSTPHQSELAIEACEALGASAAGVYTKATMHTPVHVTRDALEHLKETGADCLIAIG